MAKGSSIEWTHHTFNPWWGCAKVSPACDHCYAERDAKRYWPQQDLWQPRGPRRTFGDAHWSEPLKWDRACAKAGIRERVFCASMADVFDNQAASGLRHRLWNLILTTPHLDWLLLTKRIGNAPSMLPLAWLVEPPPNVWLGISVVNQAEAMRDIPKLLAIPAVVRFLSCEPLLGPIDLEAVYDLTAGTFSCCTEEGCEFCDGTGEASSGPHPDWIIVGGESGPKARPMSQKWVDGIHGFCCDHEVPFFFKQWGEWMPFALAPRGTDGLPVEWPIDGPGNMMTRVGKKRAGRRYLDTTHDEFPEPRTDHEKPQHTVTAPT